MIINHNGYNVETEVPEVAYELGFHLANRSLIDWQDYGTIFETFNGETFAIKSIDHQNKTVLITK